MQPAPVRVIAGPLPIAAADCVLCGAVIGLHAECDQPGVGYRIEAALGEDDIVCEPCGVRAIAQAILESAAAA